MKISKILFSIICIFFFSLSSPAQKQDTLIKSARFFMENGEYTMAIPLLQKYSIQFPGESLPYELIGDCFLETNAFGEAITNYLKSLKLNPDLFRLCYKLGSAYDIPGKSDSAIYFFRKCLSSDPNSAAANLRISIIYLNFPPGANDSCHFYAKRALEIEPENIQVYHVLAMSYFSLGDFEQARNSAMKGLERDSTEVNLLQTAGQCSFHLKEYITALEYFETAIRLTPENTLLRDYIAQALIMKNTDPQKIYFNAEGKVKFRGINSGNIPGIEEELTKPSGSYNYSTLLKKYRDNHASLGLDEFFMLYYGFSDQPEYSPYKVIDEELNKMLDIDLKKSTEIAEKLVVEYPADFQNYLTLANIYKRLGDFGKYSDNILGYFGFLESVKASGEGINPASAYIITNISHENEIVLNMRYTAIGQKLIQEKGHNYDLLSCKDSMGKEVTLCFNIDKPYQSLLKSLPGRNKSRKRNGK